MPWGESGISGEMGGGLSALVWFGGLGRKGEESQSVWG